MSTSGPPRRGGGLWRRRGGLWLCAVAASLLSPVAWSDRFVGVRYDAAHDQLVVAVAYRGTNPHHTFSLQWGPCGSLPNGGGREIEANVLDSQWQDAARRPFVTTTRFSLAGLQCRPATVTLRTAPRFIYTLQIPAPVANRQRRR